MSLVWEPWVVAVGVVAVLAGLMFWNTFMDAKSRGRAQAATAASTPVIGGIRYLVRDGAVLGRIEEEREGRMLVVTGAMRLVVDAAKVRHHDGEWVLHGEWDEAAARDEAARWS